MSALAVVILLLMAYVTYRGLVHPQQTADWLRLFSLDAAMQTDETKLARALELADTTYQARDYPAAEKQYLRVLRLDGRNFTAYYRLGLIYSHLGNNSDALESFQLASEIKPTATTLHNYGMTLFRYRDYDRAAEVLEQANAKSPNFNRHVTLARIYRITGQADKQLQHLEAACELERNNADVLVLLADAYLHNNDPTAAEKTFRHVLRLDPTNPRAREHLLRR